MSVKRKVTVPPGRVTPLPYKAVNRLAQETSPYLLQHAENPVDWYPWGEEALARARDEDRPILLSIGYAACHWCHVMERESFENPMTAALMNERFVCIKVDREERPDLDGIYMDAVVAMTGHGGWPLTAFLTPAGEPFLGGTYFPPEPRHGLPSFQQVLVAVSDLWRERREDVTRRTEVLVDALEQAAAARPSGEPLTESLLFQAVRRLEELLDPEWGGFGRAPKFPPASALELLLRRGAVEPAEKTLDGMALGGMYDLVGGGFHRYSVDEHWLVPHFEKMLYDNALLVPAYLHGWLVTGDERYREVVEHTVEYLLRDLRLDEGRFASSQDADTNGVEGLTYTWAPGEGAPDELLEPFEDGRFVLRGRLDAETRARLLEIRGGRPQPGLDDKAIASWNGLALAALAEAGRRLARGGWGEEGRALAEVLLRPLSAGGGRPPRRPRRRARWGRVPARAAIGGWAPPPEPPRRPFEWDRLPRRLRERRARPLRAARRDRRASLARGVAAPRAARGRAFRRRRAWRLLPRAEGRRAARRPQEGPLRPPGPVRQLDARLRAAASGADLRRRRAGPGRGGRIAPARRQPRPRRERVRLGPERARSLSRNAEGDRRRRPA